MRLIFTRAGLAEAALILAIFWTALAMAVAQCGSQRGGMEFPGFHRATPIGSGDC
jgi:hypothetical protein